MAVTWREWNFQNPESDMRKASGGQFTYDVGTFGDMDGYQLSHLSSLTCPYDAFIKLRDPTTI